MAKRIIFPTEMHFAGPLLRRTCSSFAAMFVRWLCLFYMLWKFYAYIIRKYVLLNDVFHHVSHAYVSLACWYVFLLVLLADFLCTEETIGHREKSF